MRPGLHLTSWFYTMLALLICGTLQAAAPPDLERYNVVWTTPSQNAAGSMPLGNGEVGLNLWVEENGDLLCYLARTGTWSEACRLLKLGRLRLQLSPNPFTRGTPFRQELKLRDGCVEIVAGPTGNAVRLRVFVDATAPVIFVTGEADQPHQVRARLETWRNDRKVLAGEELLSSWTMQEKPRNLELWESADIFSDQPADAVTWYHRNQDSIVPLTLRLQSLEPFAHLVKDPLLNRTFGGRLAAPGFKREGPQILTSEGTVRRFALQIATHCAQTTTLAEWEQELGRIAARHSQARSAAKATAAWWAEFWDRSWLFVEGDRGATVPANQHPLRLGADSNGQSLFAGRITRASVFQRALAEAEIRSLAAGKPGDAPALSPGLLAQWRAAEAHDGVVPNRAAKVLEARAVPGLTFTNEDGTVAALFNGGYLQVTNDPRLSLSNGFTLEAWIQPKPGAGPARLFDKLTAGVDDGFLFDTYPGQALRLIVGPHKLSSEACLKPGQWQHVAATFDAATGNCRLYLNGTLVAQSGSTGETTSSPVTRAYVLQRWMTACAGRGQYPIKFNGSIFTVDPEFTNGPKLNADWRRWGDAFWWQNTRLPYFPMLARGDFDQVAPLFRFYREALPLARARAKAYFNAEGAYFPETMTLFGTCANRDYGWDRTGRQPNEMVNLYIRHIWQQGLELCALMLEYYDYTRDHQFLARELVPLAHEALRFYETRFPHDGDGRLRIEPTQSVETYWYEVV
ncbi:MAG TPA: DUF5703 domain-containing protein, partial [Candidatus Sulfotelmatobacter sp.]|nr:DUF5703 domain-containing protein [Candidatus Sulfotelmatobacter sp.]